MVLFNLHKPYPIIAIKSLSEVIPQTEIAEELMEALRNHNMLTGTAANVRTSNSHPLHAFDNVANTAALSTQCLCRRTGTRKPAVTPLFLSVRQQL